MDTMLLALIAVGVVVVIVLLLRRQAGATATDQNVVQGIQQGQMQIAQGIHQRRVQMAGLAEKVSYLKPLAQAVSNLQAELRGVTEQAKAPYEIEHRTAESIRRLEAVIAGTQTKGAAGENILAFVFAQLPVEWQVRDFKVGNRTCEFGLRLPNKLILPIDSKWAATSLLEQFAACNEPSEQQRLKDRIQEVTLAKAKEVTKYLYPNVTTDFGIAAVPDAVFDLCPGTQVAAFRLNIVLISYSMFIPYLLMVHQTMLKTSQSIDQRRLEAYLKSTEDSIQALQKELDGRLSTSVTMLRNSYDSMNGHLSRVRAGISALQVSSPDIAAPSLSTELDEVVSASKVIGALPVLHQK